MPKKIIVESSSYLAIYKDYKTPWEDVWLITTIKPGRKKLKLGPCLIGRKSLEGDLLWEEKFKNEDKDLFYQEEYDLLKNALEAIDKGEYFYHYFKGEDGLNIPDIYSPKDYIDREEAEKMIGDLMMKKYGFNEIKCKWKRPGIFIQSA